VRFISDFMKRILWGFLILFLVAGTAVAGDFATEVVNATFKLFHPDSTATCFLVRREAPDTALYLVTAAHAFERIKGETAIIVLRQPKEDGTFERRDHTIKIRREDKPLWARNEKQDIAVLRLADPLPTAVVALPASAIADEARLAAEKVHMCSPLFVLTYPQRFEANGAGFPVARQGIFASPPLLPEKDYPTFLADFTTFAGDSGGPVFMAGTDGQPVVVGIVLAQYRHDEQVTTEYEERTMHHPLGLGNVLHAQYIRDTIEEAAKQNATESR
jgi:hypothetical protein